MEIESFDKFIKKVKDKAYNIEVRKKQEMSLNVVFYQDNGEKEFHENEQRDFLFEITDHISSFKPEKIEIEIYPEYDKPDFFSYSFSDTNNDRNTTVNDQNNIENPLSRLGPSTVDEYINQKIEADRRNDKLTKLQESLVNKEKEIEELNHIIEKQNYQISKLKSKIKKLKHEIDAKKNIRYYAGFAGDVLESFGVKKEKVQGALSGLMGGEKGENSSL